MRAESGSFWEATAEPGPLLQPLAADAATEVAVVGAGYTGLCAGRELARRGVSCIILDSRPLGSGASGRNGGFVSSRFRVPFSVLAKLHGSEIARRMAALAREAAECVEETIAAAEIDAARFTRYGSVSAAMNPRQMRALRANVQWHAQEFGESGSILLGQEEVRAETGSTQFVGGVLAPRSAGLHPLNYARGLATDLVRAGVAVHDRTKVDLIERNADGLVLQTPGGRVRARQVILATNGYSLTSPATRPLAGRVVPFQSAVIATAPLGNALLRQVLPTGRMAFDAKRLLRWYRIVDGRLLVGGRGASGSTDNHIAYRSLERVMRKMWPELARTPIDFRWSGFVGMSVDGLPHVGRLDDRTLFAAAYNGAGVAMSSLLGRYAARIALGEQPDLALLSAEQFRSLLLPSLHVPATRIATGYYGMLDLLGL